MPHPLVGMAIVLGSLGGLLVGLRFYQHWCSPHPEWLRKLMHMGMGGVMIALPCLFDSSWPVWLLAASALGLLSALRGVQAFKSRLGGVLGGVQRSSWGELYYPIGVAATFTLSLNDPQLADEYRAVAFIIPILLLGLADAAAALVGVAYGQWRYVTIDGEKTAEGSVAFASLAFFCAHVPLLLFTNVGRAETLWIALLLGIIAMMFEAISWHGLDNFLLPVLSYMLLRVYLGLEAAELLYRLGLTAALVVVVMTYRRRTTLVGSGLLAAILFGYIAGALGGWQWLVAPLTLFLTHRWFESRSDLPVVRSHNVDAVLSVASGGLVWLLARVLLDRPELLYPYVLSFAGHLAIIAYVRRRQASPAGSRAWAFARSTWFSWLLLATPMAAIDWKESISGMPATCLAAALAAIAGGLLLFLWTQPQDCPGPATARYWFCQGLNAAIGSSLGLVPLYVLRGQPWAAWLP